MLVHILPYVTETIEECRKVGQRAPRFKRRYERVIWTHPPQRSPDSIEWYVNWFNVDPETGPNCSCFLYFRDGVGR